jgi:putative SOS response-associated peptidase YedK
LLLWLPTEVDILHAESYGLAAVKSAVNSGMTSTVKFNARSESVTEKPIFSRLLQRQRCVVLLDGFYEWKADAGGKKQPYYVSFGEGNVMRMAGLYDMWAGKQWT